MSSNASSSSPTIAGVRVARVLPAALLAVLLAVAGWVSEAAAAATGTGGAWTETFDADVPLGSVSAGGTFPGYPSLWAYPDGTSSTHGGRYSPSTVNAVESGALTWHIRPGGVGSSVTIGPSAVGGEWSVRMRSDAITGMHIADMRWPDNDVWPGTDGSGGEIDFPEEDTDDGVRPYAAVVGNAGAVRDGKQLFNPAPTARAASSWRDWHTYTTQVVPGASVVMYQDGVEVARVTDNVPRTAIHEQFQVEPQQGGTGGSGTVQVSAVSYSPVLDMSTRARVDGTSPTASPTPSAAAAPSASSAPPSSDPSTTPFAAPPDLGSAALAPPASARAVSRSPGPSRIWTPRSSVSSMPLTAPAAPGPIRASRTRAAPACDGAGSARAVLGSFGADLGASGTTRLVRLDLVRAALDGTILPSATARGPRAPAGECAAWAERDGGAPVSIALVTADGTTVSTSR